MPLYGFDDLNKTSGSHDYRQLDLPLNVNKKIWIPKAEYVYHRTHFNVKENFPKSRFNVVDCCNQVIGQKGKGCPICELIEKFWEEWRNTKDKIQKKKIENKINRIVAEEIYFNGIDIEDPDLPFVAVRFTLPRAKEIHNIVETKKDKDIASIIWYYKKAKDPSKETSKTEYSINDIDSPELIKMALSLKARLSELWEREYDFGGPVDLENAIIRPRTASQIKEIISGSSDDATEEETVEESSSSSVEIDSDSGLSLDDIDGKSDQSENLDLDGLALGPVEPPPVKNLQITPEFINEKVKGKDMPFLNALISWSIQETLIKDAGKLNDNIKAIFAVAKSKKVIEIPETVFQK